MAMLFYDMSAFQHEDEIVVGFCVEDMAEWDGRLKMRGENSKKFLEALQEQHQGSLQQMAEKAFCGEFCGVMYFDMQTFCKFCEDYGIEYEDHSSIII